MKYDITYSCGHEGTVQLFGPGKERERKLDWMKGSALCPECYKEQRRREEKEMGLVVKIRIDHVAKLVEGEARMVAVFEGDTYPHKDDIKALGARWTEEYPSDNPLKTLTGMAIQPKRWCLWFGLGEVEDTLARIEGVGARIVETPGELDTAMTLLLSQGDRGKNEN